MYNDDVGGEYPDEAVWWEGAGGAEGTWRYRVVGVTVGGRVVRVSVSVVVVVVVGGIP